MVKWVKHPTDNSSAEVSSCDVLQADDYVGEGRALFST
jgi:hypothetical protein